MASTTQYILDYAMQNQQFRIDDLMATLPEGNRPSVASVKSTISNLINSQRLARISRGLYSFVPERKNVFKVVLGETEKTVNQLLKERFPFATFCLYNGTSLAPLQHHLSLNNITYVETERAVMESAFHYLRDKGFMVYLNPKADIVAKYIDLKSNSIIIKPLVSESPLTQQDEMIVPTLEKILVDIHQDSDFSYLQGTETDYMMENAKSLYMINTSRLQRYGRRRGIRFK